MGTVTLIFIGLKKDSVSRLTNSTVIVVHLSLPMDIVSHSGLSIAGSMLLLLLCLESGKKRKHKLGKSKSQCSRL